MTSSPILLQMADELKDTFAFVLAAATECSACGLESITSVYPEETVLMLVALEDEHGRQQRTVGSVKEALEAYFKKTPTSAHKVCPELGGDDPWQASRLARHGQQMVLHLVRFARLQSST